MKITYEITKIALETLENLPWLKANYALGEAGTRDDRVITRLLKNPHYPPIMKNLERIDVYGGLSGEVGETLLVCNDNMSFSRTLAELNLFIHLYERLGSQVIPIRRIPNQKTPDISVISKNFEALIEIYSRMDDYAHRIFSRLLAASIKNASLPFGFDIVIDTVAENLYYSYDFPEFRKVYEWLDRFICDFSSWLQNATAGDTLIENSPAGSVKLSIHINAIKEDPEYRAITFGEATRSNDTLLYFRIDDPRKFAGTDWGIRIKEKLQRQQAGKPRDNTFRILAINFALADTADKSFLNELEYHENFKEDIKYLASDMRSYPPYDVVLPCELGFECGFAKPINLSNFDDSFVEDFLSKIYLDAPIKSIPIASNQEVEAFWNSIKILMDN